MKTLVTGGAGFIGSNLVDRLIRDGHEVTVIDNESSDAHDHFYWNTSSNNYKYDINDYTMVHKLYEGVDTVFHLAALSDIVPSITHPVSYYESNVTGTLNVLEFSRKYKVKKIVYAASSSCYGIPKKYPTNEKEKLNPEYPYALTKKIAEDLVLHWSNVYNLNCTSLRLFNVYGPRVKNLNDYGAMFGIFLAQKIAKKPLTVVGDGKQSRDFTYVTDVCEAFYKAAKNNKKNINQIFNVGSGATIQINKIVKLLNSEKDFIPKRPGEPQKTFADIKKIKKYLKWKPRVKIEEGVAIMLENIDNWKNAPVWNKYNIKKKTSAWFKYLSK